MVIFADKAVVSEFMARLIISQRKKGKLTLSVPHYILINGQMLGLMRTPSVTIEVPSATFEVRIQSVFKWFYSASVVSTHEETDTYLDFTDREKWWDALFVVDILLWCVKGLFHLAAPWTWIYEIFTNGYFVAWLIYEWVIRKTYFKLEVYSKRAERRVTIRDARPSDASFLAECIMAGMHSYHFEEPVSGDMSDILEHLTQSEKREDTLYSYTRTRVAEMEGKAVGALLSYPGTLYKDLKEKTFREYWPAYSDRFPHDDPETGPGEYYLDSLAVHPDFRGKGIGRALLEDGIRRGLSQGFTRIALVVDAEMPDLISFYTSVGFTPDGHRHAFGTDFLRMIYSVPS